MSEPRRRPGSASRNRPSGGVTIYDVAEHAGVSITTVSNALNKPDRVGAASLQRVLAAIDELGFVPKAAAVSQARKGVGRIGVLAPFTSYESFRTRLVGVLQSCQGRAVEVVVLDGESAADATSPLLSSLPMTGRLDGLLLMGLPLQDAMAERLVQRKLVTVLVDSYYRDLSSVNIGDEHGGHLVGEHLVGRGHRTFAYVSEAQQSRDFLSQGQKRMGGFVGALAAAGVAEQAVRHVVTTHDVTGGRRAAAQIMAEPHRPDAVFAHFDDIAAGLVVGFRAGGLRVPEDIAVVGYDDGPLADALGITTVHQPFVRSGEAGCTLLLDRLYGGATGTQHITLPADLVVRATT